MFSRTFLRTLLSIFLVAIFTPLLIAQHEDVEQISSTITQQDVEFDIYFLASDEFLGRDTGTQELKIASRYIATRFQTYGINKPEEYDSYFQDVPLQRISAPEKIHFTAGDSSYHKDTDLITLGGVRDSLHAPIIVLEHATEEELAETDVEGAIVIAEAGLPGQTSPQQFFQSTPDKMEWVQQAGGIALIELYTTRMFPWQVLVNFLGGEQIISYDPEQAEIPVLWMNAADGSRIEFLTEMSSSESMLQISGNEPDRFTSRNVIGVLEGTDPYLKDEYILLGAHYDHLGVVPGQTEGNYIYNGARDNAVGTSGVLAAAKYFSENPPKRSIIFATWTAEEVGLLGSAYYAENPAVPLENTIYNLNIDGAGYNDTTKVTVIGLGRTEADDEMIAAADAFGLEAIPDPVPEQNLFDRSDNVNFAQKGIPAPTYSMGITAFDEEIEKYYHQVTDEPDTINYDYVTNYIRSFVLATLKISEREEAPFWISGDVYEEAGKQQYGRD